MFIEHLPCVPIFIQLTFIRHLVYTSVFYFSHLLNACCIPQYFVQLVLIGCLVHVSIYVQSALIKYFLYMSIQPLFSRYLLHTSVLIQPRCLSASYIAGTGDTATNKIEPVFAL